MNRTTLAAAIAAVLASGSAMAQPSIGQIAAVSTGPGGNTINIAGSSAIKTALINNIYNNFCQGGSAAATTVTSNGSNKNFEGISCFPQSGAASNTNLYNIWLRVEGGSVSGYLPIVNNIGIKQINGPALTANPITINGASTGNGVDDSFTVSAGGSLAAAKVDLGIGDVEPAALINNNYPTAYSTAVWGAQNPNGMFHQAATQLVDEVYAIFVNENSSAFTENPLVLSQQTVANILARKIKNWSQVYDTSGNAVATSLGITVVNREAGSGSRAATDILVAGDGCGSAAKAIAISDAASATDYFSTGDVLTAANSVPGAISYATIDNQYFATLPETGAGSTSFPHLTMVSLNGVVPSNLAAASGTYPFWVEASYVDNSGVTGADDTAIKTIIAGLQQATSTSSLADINAIPGISTNTTVHADVADSGIIPTGGAVTIYINPYTRGGTTCSTPLSLANTFP